MEEKQSQKKKVLQGVITSDAGDKTVVVSVSRFVKHVKYGKFYKVSKKYHAHDENNTYKKGEIVKIAETTPYSKKKKFIVVEKA